MDIPQPPADTELRNIIDKLAQFVARNGLEFEQMTKTKQKGNPKFQFLYGGEYFNYYQYKVTTEQAILKQQGIIGMSPNSWNQSQNNGGQNTYPGSVGPNNFHNNSSTFPNNSSQNAFQNTACTPNSFQNNPNQNTYTDLEQINQQQESLREQIKQSELNLSAQHTVLIQQQQAQIEATMVKCENAELQREAATCNINLQKLHGILQPIIDSCTKDSISNGKSWILQHATSKSQAMCIAHCLLQKVVHGTVPFPQKLHIIYLVNDVLHHCARKNANDLKDALESVVVPMFCSASMGATEEVQKNKLDKLLKLWESKANYLAADTVQKMRQPTTSYQQYQADQLAKYASDVNMLTQQTKATFDSYQAQHQAFVCHAMAQIMELEQQKQTIDTATPSAPIQNQNQDSNGMQSNPNIPIEISYSQQQGMNPPNPSAQLPPTDNYNSIPPMNLNVPPPTLSQPPNGGIEIPSFSQPPPGFFPTPGVFPDFSKPPPGFPVPPKPEPTEELLPSVPYYDLPAGLIVPLIKLEDTSFKPLDPKDIRLPPPAPPSERLLAAVEAFYAPPSHDRPRDSEGWEKLGLYEYYKAKNIAKKEKEEQIAAGLRQKSRSPSPVIIVVEKSPSPPRRRYTSKSPSPQHRDRRSRSRSPRRRRSRGSKRRRSNSRSRSRSPVNRSPSPNPPSFSSTAFMRNQDVQELDSSNKGHQMLRKMGWGGSGLGLNEQGIDAPISGGDVRDRQDQFKGVGCNLNDPYENFRKNKGAAFITRMKARAEERANESKAYE